MHWSRHHDRRLPDEHLSTPGPELHPRPRHAPVGPTGPRIPGRRGRRSGDQCWPFPPKVSGRHQRTGRLAAAHLQPLQHRLATTIGPAPGPAVRAGPRVLQQFRRRGQRDGAEVGAFAWLEKRHRTAVGGRDGERLPRPHARHHGCQRRAFGAPGVPAIARRFHQDWVWRHGGSGGGHRAVRYTHRGGTA